MKKTGKLSFLMAMIIAITNVVFISVPSVVGAQESDIIVSDDFEGYTAITTDATLAAMQELCDMNPWWYSSGVTTFNEANNVVGDRPLIASVVEFDGDNALRLTNNGTAGIGTNIAVPTEANQYTYDKNSYEVSFKFYATGDAQIFGIGGKKLDNDITYYVNNILSKQGKGAYIGDTSHNSDNGGIGGTGINSNMWYTIKVIVNNGLGYYSVEILDANGKSLQRVGGINFQDGCPAISNIRFQATSADSVVYIDDYVAKKVAPDNLLYEDDFNIYTGFSGTNNEGANIFKEISQFRLLTKGSTYTFGGDSTNKNLVLNKNANTIYMPWNGYILTKDSQTTRGKLRLKFSVYVDSESAPKDTTASFRVICADKLNGSNIADLGNNKYTMFRIQPFAAGDYRMQNSDASESTSGYFKIEQATSYDVQLSFDLINDKVEMIAVKSGTTSPRLTHTHSTGLYNGGTPLESIKSVMFQTTNGMKIGIDNVELKYIPNVPQISTSGVEVIDFNGEKVATGETDVNPAIAKIKVPFTCAVTDDSVKNITFTAENTEVETPDYAVTNVDGVYTMTFRETLAPNTKYILTVPNTVANVAGGHLAQTYTYEFTTGADKDVAEMEIEALSVNSLEGLTNGSEVKIRTKYANTADSKNSYIMIVAYYDANNALLTSTCKVSNIDANAMNMNAVAGFTIPTAEVLDMSKVNKVSVYLWDSYGNIRPYCESVDILRVTEDSE